MFFLASHNENVLFLGRQTGTTDSASLASHASGSYNPSYGASWHLTSGLAGICYIQPVVSVLESDGKSHGENSSFYLTGVYPPSKGNGRYFSDTIKRYTGFQQYASNVKKFFRGQWDDFTGSGLIHRPDEHSTYHENIRGFMSSGEGQSFDLSDGTATTLFEVSELALDPGKWGYLISTTENFSLPYSWSMSAKEEKFDAIESGTYNVYGSYTTVIYSRPVMYIYQGYTIIELLRFRGQKASSTSSAATWYWTCSRCRCTYNAHQGATPKPVSAGPTYDLATFFDPYNRSLKFSRILTGNPAYGYAASAVGFSADELAGYFGLSIDPSVDMTTETSYFYVDCSQSQLFFINVPDLGYAVRRVVGASSAGPNYYISSDVGTYSHFHKLCITYREDTLAGCGLAAQNAVDDLLEAPDVNLVETLSEIGSVTSGFGVAELLGQYKATVKAGQLLGYLKLLANANLCYKFGIVPTVSDGRHLASLAQRGITYLTSIKTLEGRGKYTLYDPYFLSEYDSPVITYWSKVVAQPLRDSFWPYVLPLEKAGLTPSLTNIWNAIPYSFMIDYLHDISFYTRTVDQLVRSFFIDVEYSVNSIKVEARPPVSRWEDYGVPISSFAVEEHLTYKNYLRFVMNDIPLVTPTKLGILPDLRLPSWDIAGSLIVGRL